jgi:hypothetical protein
MTKNPRDNVVFLSNNEVRFLSLSRVVKVKPSYLPRAAERYHSQEAAALPGNGPGAFARRSRSASLSCENGSLIRGKPGSAKSGQVSNTSPSKEENRL